MADNTGVEVVSHLVKFEVQLYKVRDDEFVIDMQVRGAWHACIRRVVLVACARVWCAGRDMGGAWEAETARDALRVLLD
jgi:hypothetical protein